MATATSEEAAQQATLAIDGMTCASCAVRIERRLNRLGGVSASVNFASEQAATSFDPAPASIGTLIRAVEAAGYHASLPDGLRAPDSITAWLGGVWTRLDATRCSRRCAASTHPTRDPRHAQPLAKPLH